MSSDQKRRRGTLLCMLLHSAAVIYEAVECVRPRSLSLTASEANYGHQCFVALDLDFSQVSANFTAFAKVCRLLYILYCLLLLLLIASCWCEIPFHHNTQFSVVRHGHPQLDVGSAKRVIIFGFLLVKSGRFSTLICLIWLVEIRNPQMTTRFGRTKSNKF